MSLTIGLIAPSGQILDPQALDRAVAYFESEGCKVFAPAAIRAQHQRFAGTDATRLRALHAMVARKEVDVIIAVRGGYGLSRLLGQIDYEAIAQSGKLLCGHSDFTALSLALYAKTKTISLAGPTALFDFGAEPDGDHDLAAHNISSFTAQHFWQTLHDRADEISFATRPTKSFDVRGRLWGSNLKMLVSLIGTPYLPKIKGGILFAEDINEHPFRIERMLYQLLHSGVLAQQKALVLADFSGYKLYPNDQGYSFDEMVKHFASVCPIPVLTGLPFGHIRDKVTLPIGAMARLQVQSNHARLGFRF